MKTSSSETLISWKYGKKYLCPSMEPNGGIAALDSDKEPKLYIAGIYI
jgi:hypothetical protein